MTQDNVERYFAALAQMNRFSGAVLLSRGGKVAFAKYFGSYDLGNEFEPLPNSNFFFPVGSLSKTVTATAILQLYDKKMLKLDQDVSGILQDFNIPKRISIDELLNHTSGLPVEIEGISTKDEFVESLKTVAWGRPGEFRYSNIGYQILALVIEKISGSTYHEYLKDHVFKPISIETFVHFDNSNLPGRLAKGLSDDCGTLAGVSPDTSYKMGSGDVVASLHAISKFYESLYSDRIVSRASRALMFSSTSPNGYGYGLEIKTVDGQTFWGHNGSLPGYKTFAYMDENNNHLIVLSNIEQFPLAKAVSDGLAFLSGGEVEFPQPIIREEVEVNYRPVLRFQGTYAMDFDPDQQVELVFDDEENYFFLNQDMQKTKLYPESSNRYFFCKSSDDTVEFVTQEDASHLIFTVYGGARLRATMID